MSHNHLLTISVDPKQSCFDSKASTISVGYFDVYSTYIWWRPWRPEIYTRKWPIISVLLFFIKHATHETLWDALSFIRHRYWASPFAINCLDATSCVVRAPLFFQFHMIALMFSSEQALHVRVEDHETVDWNPKFWFFPASDARQDQTCYSGHL